MVGAFFLLTLTAPGYARAQEAISEPGATIEEASTLELDQQYDGAIDVPGDVDVFAVPITPSLAVFRVHVVPQNTTCEVWASSLDRAATEFNRIFAPRDGASIATITVTEDTMYVRIDSGPFNLCAGARYSVRATGQPLNLTAPSDDAALPAVAQSSPRERLLCMTYCQAASKSATRMRDLRNAIAQATAKRKQQLRKALRRVTRVYRKNHRLELYWCRRAQM